MKKQITLIVAVAAISGLTFFAWAEETPENQAEKRPAPPSAEELFAKMDKNADGQLSLEEFQEAMKDRPRFAGKRGPGPEKPFDGEFGKGFDRDRGDRGPGKGMGPHGRRGFGPLEQGQFDDYRGRGPGERMGPPFGRMDGMMGMHHRGDAVMQGQGAPIIIVINGMNGLDAPFLGPLKGKGNKPFPGKPNFGPGPCCDDKPCGCDKPCEKCCKDDGKCPCQGKEQCPIMEKKEEAAQ